MLDGVTLINDLTQVHNRVNNTHIGESRSFICIKRPVMSQPLISIILTVLNGEKTLDKCLLSIESQTFLDYELIIVEGGSKDNTLQIIQDSTIRNKRVNVLQGIGLYAGLNAGIKLSTGQWLYFIGADDELYEPNTLHKISKIIGLTNKDTAIYVGNVNFIKQEMLFRPTFGSPPYWMRHEVHHQGMFYAKHLFDDLLYNEDMRIASDYELNLKLAIADIVHQHIDVIVCNFGGDGISENQLENRYSEMDEVYQRLFNGVDYYLVVSYFWLRRKTGRFIRRYNFLRYRDKLKRIFA